MQSHGRNIQEEILTAKTTPLNQKAVQVKLNQDASGKLGLHACCVLTLPNICYKLQSETE